MLFPLGLGSKIKQFPQMTVGISVALIAFFVLDSSSREMAQEELMMAFQRDSLRLATGKLFVDFCRTKNESTEHCVRLAQVLRIADLRKDQLEEDLKPQRHEILESRSLYFDMDEEIERKSRAIQNLSSYKNYEKELAARDKDVKDVHKRYGHYSQLNSDTKAMLLSQLRHADIPHLLFNLLTFIPFAIYVERRLGAFFFALTYIVCGLVASFLNTKIFLEPFVYSVGASASISGTMGMFFFLFIKRNMRFIVPSFPIAFATAPIVTSFPLLFVAGEVLTTVQEKAYGVESGVGHTAHWIGMATGILLAYLAKKLDPLHEEYLFHDDRQLTEKLAKETSIRAKMNLTEEIFAVNPQTTFSRGLAVTVVSNTMTQNEKSLTAQDFRLLTSFLQRHLPTFCAINTRRKNRNDIFTVLEKIPPYVSFREILDRLGQENTLQLAAWAMERSKNLLALRLLDSYLRRFPDSKQHKKILLCGENILETIAEDNSARASLRMFLNSSPLSPFYKFLPKLDAIEANTTKNDTSAEGNHSSASSKEAPHPTEAKEPTESIIELDLSASDITHLQTKQAKPAAEPTQPAPRAKTKQKPTFAIEEDLRLVPDAQLGARAAAAIIDLTFLPIVSGLAYFVASYLLYHLPWSPDGDFEIFYWIASISVGPLMYLVLPTAMTGQTFGKRIIGIRAVSSLDSEDSIPLGRALGREIASKILTPAFPFLVGAFAVALARKNPVFYDSFFNTRVVQYRQLEALKLLKS